MYLNHYNLKSKPFEITSDPEFLWLGEKHKEAFSVLRYGVLENKGVLLLTGDVGVGKTTLIAALVKDLSEEIIHTTIADPGVPAMDFYRYLAHGYGLETSFDSKADFMICFRAFLKRCRHRGKRVLLIIDEAQRMGLRLLEDVRHLSNIEIDGVKLINVFFVGQNEFLESLASPRVRALRQRVALSYNITPLDLNETYRYIASRLKRAGAQTNYFTKAAIEEIHLYSGGAPRMINVLCDMAMVVGYSKGVKRLEKQTVRDGARKLPSTVVPIKTSAGCTDLPPQPSSGMEGQVFDVPEAFPEPDSYAETEFLPGKQPSGLRPWLLGLLLVVLVSAGLRWDLLPGEAGLRMYAFVASKLGAPSAPGEAAAGLPVTYPVVVYFEQGGGLDPRSEPLVQAVASSLNREPETLVLVRGVAQTMPDDAGNVDASLVKAGAVKKRLVAAGVRPERIRVLGLGSAKEPSNISKFQGLEKKVYVEIDVVR